MKPQHLFIFVMMLWGVSHAYDACYPHQVHISLGDAYYNVMYNYNSELSGNEPNSSVIIIWQTNDACQDSNLLHIFSEDHSYDQTFIGENFYHESINLFINESTATKQGPEGNYTSTSHTAYIYNLKYGVAYTYELKYGDIIVGPYTFTLPDPSPNSTEPMKFVIYADIDTQEKGNHTIDYLTQLVHKDRNAFTAQLLLGDVAYDIYNDLGLRGEYFFNTVQNFSAVWPMMFTPGNHEWYANYSLINFRTRMPLHNKTSNQYFSFNIGKIHFITANIDYFVENADATEKYNMLAWLRKDLEYANSTRDVRPWIVAMTHRAIYCSENSPDDKPWKRCYNFYNNYSDFEELWDSFKVDLVLQAHMHFWERMGPVSKNNSAPYYSPSEDTGKHSIINPQAPVYTLDGSAGNNYFMVKNMSPLANYSINHDTDIAFSTLSLVNDSCLLYEHIRSSDGAVIDYFYLMKGSQYPYPKTPGTKKTHNIWLLMGVVAGIALAAFIGYKKWWKRKIMSEREVPLQKTEMMDIKVNELII